MMQRRQAHDRRSQVALSAFFALFLFAAVQLGMPACAQAATTDATITVKQDYTSESTSVQKDFTYVMEAITEGAPLPEGASGQYTWTMTADDEVTLTISYELNSDTTYEYRMYQQAVNPAADGFTYDETKYKVQLVPLGADDGQSTLIAYNESASTKVSEPSWTIKYEMPSYYVYSGDGQIWKKGSGEDATFVFKRNRNDDIAFEHFTGIRVDGMDVDAKNYTAVEGSVIVNLKAAFLETLSTGDHTIEALFDDDDPKDSVVATFEVITEQNDPNGGGGSSNSGSTSAPLTHTGDTTMPIWPLAALGGTGLALAAVGALRLRKVNRAKK